MSASINLDGKAADVIERASKHVLANMPRSFSGHSMDAAEISLDQDRRAALFKWRDGFRAAAPAQVVGVYLEAEGKQQGIVSWQWAWSNSLFKPEMTRHAAVLKAWGEANQVEEILAKQTQGLIERCWAYAMLTAALNGVDNVVGLPRPGGMVLLTVGPLHVE